MSNSTNESWIGRNWKWFVPSLIACFMVLIFGFFMIVMSIMKSTDAYQKGVSSALANKEVQEALGEPITVGLIVSGNIQVTNDYGSANMSIPIAGPKGEGTIFVVGNKLDGRWSYSHLIVQLVGSNKQIDLQK